MEHSTGLAGPRMEIPRGPGQSRKTGQSGTKARKAVMEQKPGAANPTTRKGRCRRTRRSSES
eukprot:9852198-Heterocapsa_arctica.AAC.1